jgi:hypothetical protein
VAVILQACRETEFTHATVARCRFDQLETSGTYHLPRIQRVKGIDLQAQAPGWIRRMVGRQQDAMPWRLPLQFLQQQARQGFIQALRPQMLAREL